VVKIDLFKFMITKSKYPISRELSRYLNRILYINNKLIKLESEYYIFDEYLRRLPKQPSGLNGFFFDSKSKTYGKNSCFTSSIVYS
jgi:hypothetical protein